MSFIKKIGDHGIGTGDTHMAMQTHRKGIHVMKDAAVTRKMVPENLASCFCRKLLTVLFRLFLQIIRYEKHVMSNGVIKTIIIIIKSIGRCAPWPNRVEILTDKERTVSYTHLTLPTTPYV